MLWLVREITCGFLVFYLYVMLYFEAVNAWPNGHIETGVLPYRDTPVNVKLRTNQRSKLTNSIQIWVFCVRCGQKESMYIIYNGVLKLNTISNWGQSLKISPICLLHMVSSNSINRGKKKGINITKICTNLFEKFCSREISKSSQHFPKEKRYYFALQVTWQCRSIRKQMSNKIQTFLASQSECQNVLWPKLRVFQYTVGPLVFMDWIHMHIWSFQHLFGFIFLKTKLLAPLKLAWQDKNMCGCRI